MKTINKILPLAILASATAVVTPLATSCSGASSVTWFDGLEEIDPTDLYYFGPDEVSPIEAANDVGQLIYTVEHSTDPDMEEYKESFKKDLMYGRFYIGDQILPHQFTDLEFDHYKYSIETLKQDIFVDVGSERYVNLYSYKGDIDMQFMCAENDGIEIEEGFIEITAKAHIDVHCVPLTVYSEDDSNFNPYGQNAMGFFPVLLDLDAGLPTWMYLANDWYFSWSFELTQKQLDENKQPRGSTITDFNSIYLDANHLVYVEDPTDYADVSEVLPKLFFPYGQITLAWPSYCLNLLEIEYN